MRPTKSSACLALLVVAATCADAQISVPFLDDFNDNSIAAEWDVIEDAPAQLTILEQNGRVELIAPNSTNPTNDALFISNGTNGFRLLTSSDFEIRLSYSFASFDSFTVGNAFALVLGVGRDLPDGTDSAAVGFGYVGTTIIGPTAVPGASVQYRVDDVPSSPVGFVAPTSGNFVITYTNATDRLSLGIEGASSVNLDGIVRGTWDADDVYVSFGGRGSGFVTDSGDAWLDNFEIISGSPIPEPSTALLAGIAAVALFLRRDGRSLRSRPARSHRPGHVPAG
jgi:hypothetical protein